ncbi:MAG: hypothetical protein EHM55_23580 [Acidobacteria bacterium]|nr:MAG: hypothetical protein EHM55_23580 [Acidobacteriota bacterium]
MIQAALNGTRSRSEYAVIPTRPAQLATEARASVAAGADAIHVHVRDRDGNESLNAKDIAATLDAIRSACPGIPVGVSTGDWIVPDLHKRLSLIDSWSVLPDFVSVNLHEAGSLDVFRLLLGKNIGVEAGVWNAPAAKALVESGLADRSVRILLEPAEASCSARINLRQIESALAGVERPRLLHGLGRCAWDLVALAAERGYDTRIGFEDTLRLPDGTRAASNADLVSAARRIVRFHTDHA